MRYLFSTLAPLLLMLYGWKRKGVNKSGAAFGLVVAIILSIASHAFLASLATFYFTSSRATKFGSKKKQQIESDFKGGESIGALENPLQFSRCRYSWKLILKFNHFP